MEFPLLLLRGLHWLCVCVGGGGMCVGGGGSKLGGKLDNTLPVRYLFEFFLEDNYFIT